MRLNDNFDIIFNTGGIPKRLKGLAWKASRSEMMQGFKSPFLRHISIDKLGLFKYMYLGDTDIENPKFKDNLIKVKADLFEAILGAVAIDSDWNQDKLQNVVEFMLQIDDFLADVDTEEPRPSKFQLENAVTTLKELAEKGRCSIPEYYQAEEQVLMNDGTLMWECTCYIRSWSMKHTAYATSKKEAKRYAAYLVLYDFYGLPDEFSEED